MNFPQYISTLERTVSVVGFIDTKENEDENFVFNDGKGYVDKDGLIWIYSANGKPKNKNEYPYFWYNKDKEMKFSNPEDDVKKKYSIENMIDMSVVNIIDTTDPNEELFDEEAINTMNSSVAFYSPDINDEDDFLKKIVKCVIIMKGIDINRLKSKTGEKYDIPNMKHALQHKTKMSVSYFCKWMELLGCNFEICISDNTNDKTNPLKLPIVYQSYGDKCSELVKGALIDLDLKLLSQKDDEEEE